MQAVVDSKSGAYFRCMLENGDIITINSSDIDQAISIGDIVEVVIKKDEKASERQKVLMK